jgi:UDP-glucuronate 4-epimerase
MKILVTGGAGFIGYHLSVKLLQLGNKVVSVDNLSDYYVVSLKKARINRLEDKSSYKFIKTDILDYPAMVKIFQRENFDLIVHLAAIAGVAYALEHGDEYVRTNEMGTYNIFELARHHGRPKIIYASSSAVYGNTNILPYREDQITNRPNSLYGATKKSNELLAYTYAFNFKLPSIGLRFFTVYGPWGRPDMALFLFTDGIAKGRPIKVNNRGEMYRDFTYVDDIVDGIVASINYDTSYDIINLGRGEKVGLLEFIHEIEKKMNKKAKLDLLPMPVGEAVSTLASNKKANQLLGYQPKVSVKQGVISFIDWYRAYYKI